MTAIEIILAGELGSTNAISLSAPLMWSFFCSKATKCYGSGGGSLTCYPLPWRDFLLILCALFRNVYRAIKRLQLTTDYFEQKAQRNNL